MDWQLGRELREAGGQVGREMGWHPARGAGPCDGRKFRTPRTSSSDRPLGARGQALPGPHFGGLYCRIRCAARGFRAPAASPSFASPGFPGAGQFSLSSLLSGLAG